MAVTLKDSLEFEIKCPLCGKRERIRIDKSDLYDNPVGVLRVPIEHNIPVPHILVLDVDPSGFIRGAYLIKKYASIDSLSKSAKDIIRDVGIENFSRLLGWLLAGYEPKLKDGGSIGQNLAVLLRLVFDGARKNKKTIRVGVTKVPEPPFSVDILKRIIAYALDHIGDDKALVAFIKNEIGKYADAMNKVLERLSNGEDLDLKALRKLLGDSMTDQEIKFVVAIITTVRPDFKRRFDIAELKIADLF